tara:strand:+ start:1041 stop:1214 length:174 start_codon:yes stop_codon:yes gene_type:complete
MAPMGPGTYGSKKGRPKKKERSSEARTGSFPMKPKPAAGAKAMKAATMALLKKKKKK